MRKLLSPALFLIAALCMGAIGGSLPLSSITGLGTNVSTWLTANLTLNGAAKFNGSGVLSQAASTDLSDTTTATTWTPTDQSGASLSFSGPSGNYGKLNKMCVGTTVIVYPSTASGSTATISLPCTINSGANGAVGVCRVSGGGTTRSVMVLFGTNGQANATFIGTDGNQPTNANFSTQTLSCSFSFVALT